MKAKKRAIVYHRHGVDPEKDRIVYEHDGRQTILAGADNEEEVTALIKQLVKEGVELIELCGSMGVQWQAKAKEIAGDKVAVATILFGIESLISVADFNARYNAGKGPFIEAFIIIQPGTNPATDRKVISDEFGHSTFVAVPDATAAIKVAAELAEAGTQLIELYGEFTPASAAQVIEATGNGKVAIGVSAFGPDSY